MTKLYEWIVIGGGPQGMILTGALVKSGQWSLNDIAVVDPNPMPLSLWHRRAANCYMRNLRSDVRYHLDCSLAAPYTLLEWAEEQHYPDIAEQSFVLDQSSGHVVARNALFHAHCQWFLNGLGLPVIWQQGLVESLVEAPHGQGWQVRLSNGQVLHTRRVVIATGPGQPNYPEWATGLSTAYHLLELDKPAPDWQNMSHVTVVGGGLSSANFLLKLGQTFAARLTLLIRHPLKPSVLEIPPEITQLPFQYHFKRSDYGARRTLISQSRMGGTVPPLVLAYLMRLPQLEVVEDTVTAAHVTGDGSTELALESGKTLSTEGLVLGTGFARTSWAKQMVTQLAEQHGVPLSACGFAMPAPNLEWLPGLYLMGETAELELGPVCRNLAGAGRAAARIMAPFTEVKSELVALQPVKQGD